MKKTICFALAALTVSAAVLTGIKVSRSSSDFDLMTANVEALVEQEIVHGVCYNQIKSMPGSKIAYCGTCTWLPGKTTDESDTDYCN